MKIQELKNAKGLDKTENIFQETIQGIIQGTLEATVSV